MIRFRTGRSAKRDIAFIGLSEENVARLKAGKPIRIKRDDPLGLGVEVVIYHGADEIEMTRELENHGFMPQGSTEKAREAIEQRGRLDITS